MRRYLDPDGNPWDVVIGRESWGTLYAIFVPAGAGREEAIRQALLGATGPEEAERELGSMGEDRLRRLFEESEPK